MKSGLHGARKARLKEIDWLGVQSPELTAEEMAKANLFAQAFPELAASIRRGRGPNKAPTKKPVSPRLSAKSD
jgi:hypothetical protein